jgi:aminodeoxychorismate synthase component I
VLCAAAADEFVALDWVELELARPFIALVEQFLDEPFAVFLDSAASDSPYARHSILAVGPARVWSAWSVAGGPLGEAELEIREWDERRFGPACRVRREQAQAFAALDRQLRAWALPPALVEALPELPFIGGAIGFASYDAGRFLERLPERAERDVAVPEYCWLFADAVLVHAHESGVTRLVVTGRGATAELARAAASQLRDTFQARLAEAPRSSPVLGAPRIGPVRAYADADAYAETVRAVKSRLLAGDVFEVSVAHRLRADYAGSPWPLYRALRSLSPAAFACYVVTPWASLLSSSPERFLALDRAGRAESRPIKGTRPRGATPHEDEQLRAELARSEKDRAENIMIVDLVRNDFGRVCAIDSVHVSELMIVEQHPRVFHMVSTIRGQLADGQGAVQLFTACFPPGSMTGAPKIEALKIIDALEPYRRNIYAGAVGYFDVRGSLDFSVVIRSFVICGDQCHFSVGGAVVIDSDPYAEYRETLDKARALLEALEQLRAARS